MTSESATTRQHAIDLATEHVDSGAFLADLTRRVAVRTDSTDPDNPALGEYLCTEIAPAVEALGATTRIVPAGDGGGHPALLASLEEDPALPTVLVYGHADVQPGLEGRWSEGLDPWRLEVRGDRWYGRGTADNKGQHGANLAALAAVRQARGGRLGFNLRLLVETAEEVGSPGLRELAAAHRDELTADVLIASDGPRAATDAPTVFLGSRGVVMLTLTAERDGSHHSGNWGGLLRNPATELVNALATLVDGRGRLLVDALRPPPVPDAVRELLADVTVGEGGPDNPQVDDAWGEPGLSRAERLLAWNTLEVLAMTAGTPESPVGAVPASAVAHLQLRFVVGTDWRSAADALRAHLDAHGFENVRVDVGGQVPATRTDPTSPWVTWVRESLRRTTSRQPVLLPNLGGTLPNDVFADVLGMPTLWVPHSHPGCRQHAPDEHLLAGIAREAVQLMAGVFWDLGEPGTPARTR